MPLLIRTNQYMHFYLVTLNTVPPIVCVQNYEDKDSAINSGVRGERGQFTGEDTVCTFIANTKLSTKECY